MISKKIFLIFALLVPLTLFFFAFAFAAHAQNPFDIEFPISELGNCGSIEECRAYCEEPGNFDACGRWAADNGFAEDDALAVPPEGGPGGCLSDDECRVYCESDEHFNECIDFAAEHGHVSPQEVAQIKERHNKGGPGGCRSREECDAFCNNPDNRLACFEFAVSEGHIPPEEADRIRALLSGELPNIPRPGEFGPRTGRGSQGPGPGEPQIDEQKAARAIAEFGGPGGCAGFSECEAFCSTSGNETTCFDYAIEHGLMDREDAEKFKRLSQIEGPGGCRGRECEAYCEEPGHERECLAFAREQGFIGEEEFEQINKFVSVIEEKGGPGGCRGRECETFCNNPENRDACFEFAKSNNLLPPQELERIEKFKTLERKVEEQGGPGGCRGERECHAYCSDSAHFDECAAFAVKEGFLAPDEAERSLREFIEIEQFGPPNGPGGFAPGGPGGFGPGGFPGDASQGGFGPQGFGPSGSGEFPPGFERIPEEFRAQVEEQFKSRFEQFEQFRREFEERGERDFPPPQEFPGQGPSGGVFPGQGDFPAPDQFPQDGRFEFREEFHGDEFRSEGRFEQFSPEQERQEFERREFRSFEPGLEQEFRSEFQGQFEQEFQNQFNQEFQRQFEEQFRQESGGFIPLPPGPGDPSYIDNTQKYDCSLLDCGPSPNYCDPWAGCQIGEGGFNPDGSSCEEGFEYHSERGCIPFGTGDYDFPDSSEPTPSSSLNILNIFANILSALNPALR